MSDATQGGESGAEIGQIPQLSKSFEDITDKHEKTRKAVENQIDKFISTPDETLRPVGIRGPYRSGKTQLEYHAFDYAWKNGVPAVYIGSPKEAIEEFLKSDEESISDWWDQRAQQELGNLVADGEVEWFPDVPAEQRADWIAERVDGQFTEDDFDRYVIIIDELEQSYEKFLQAAETDDDNPLRKLNDELPNTLSIWSFGLLSAYEFIGDADMGRPREVSIPPLDVDKVNEMLVENDRSLTPLENVIWWASRGRAAWVNKFAEELSETDLDNPMGWLDSLKNYRSVEVDMVDPIWGDVTGYHEEAAAALAFQENGYDEWLISSEKSLTLDDALTIVEETLAEVIDLDSTSSRTKQVLYEQLKDVVPALAIRDGDQQLLPLTWLNEDEDADSLLDLLQYHLVSFEAGTDERGTVYDLFEDAKGELAEQWVQELQTRTAGVDQPSWTASPARLKDAFPPLVMNANRLTEQDSEHLRSEMNAGLKVNEHELVDMYFCPTQATFDETVSNLTQSPDITQPVLLFVKDDVDARLDGAAAHLEDYDVLRVETKEVQRVWDFIAQIYGYLRNDSTRTNAYYLDSDVIDELVNEAEEREVRTAIKTLYKHLTRQTSIRDVRDLEEDYLTQFSRPNAETIIWAEEPWAGEPTWTNAPLSDQRLSLVTLLGWGAEPNWNNEGEIPRKIEQALDSDKKDLIPTDDFKYTELIKSNFSSTVAGGFLTSVTSIREECRQQQEGPISTVTNLTNLLDNLIELEGTEEIFDSLDQIENDAEDIPLLSGLQFPEPVANEHSDAVIRAAMVETIVRDDDYVTDKIGRVHSALKDNKQTIQSYIQDVDDVETELEPIDDIEAPSVELSTAELEEYKDNITAITQGLADAKERAAETPDIRPTAYVLTELARRYEQFMTDRLDRMREDVPTTGNVAQVSGLQQVAGEFRSELIENDIWTNYLDADESVEDIADDFLADILDLTNEAGDTVSVPDDNNVIANINNTAEERMRATQALLSEFTALKQADSRLDEALEDSERKLERTIETIVAEGADNE